MNPCINYIMIADEIKNIFIKIKVEYKQMVEERGIT